MRVRWWYLVFPFQFGQSMGNFGSVSAVLALFGMFRFRFGSVSVQFWLSFGSVLVLSFLGFSPVPVPQLLRNSELVPSRSLRESGVPRNSRNRPAAGIRYFQRYSNTNIMYIIAFLRNTVRTIVHRMYVDRTCTFYVVPRYLRNRGLRNGTTVPHISRKSRPASSAAGPNPSPFTENLTSIASSFLFGPLREIPLNCDGQTILLLRRQTDLGFRPRQMTRLCLLQ